MSQTITAGFQASDRFLKCFFVGLSNAHDFTYGAHLCTKLIFHTFKFFKGPAGKFDYHVVSVGNVFVQCAVFSTWNVLQGQTGCKHGGNQCDGETGSFGCQGRGTGSTRIDFNNNNTVGNRIVGELNIGSSNDLYRFHDFVCLLLKTLLTFFGNGQHGSRAEGVTGVHTEGIDIFNEADRDHVVVFVADNFQLQLLPAQNRFFNQNLSHQTGLQTSGTDNLQLFTIINKAAAGAAHGISRAKYNRIAQLVCNGQSFFHAVSYFASCHFNAKCVHGLFKFDTVFSALDGIGLYSDDFYVILIQNPRFI